MQVIRNNCLKDYSKKVQKNKIDAIQKHKIKKLMSIQIRLIKINNNKFFLGEKKIQLNKSKQQIKIANYLKK
jgi:hypothetical protein